MAWMRHGTGGREGRALRSARMAVAAAAGRGGWRSARARGRQSLPDRPGRTAPDPDRARSGPGPPPPAGGRAAADPQGRIVGGTTTTAANHPWQAALVLDATGSAATDLDAPLLRRLPGHALHRADGRALRLRHRPGLRLAPSPVLASTTRGDGTRGSTPTTSTSSSGRTTLTGDRRHREQCLPDRLHPRSATTAATKQNDFAYISLDGPALDAAAHLTSWIANNGPSWKVGAPTRVTGYGLDRARQQPEQERHPAARRRSRSSPTTPAAAPSSTPASSSSRFRSAPGTSPAASTPARATAAGPLQTAAGAASGTTRLVGIVSFGSGCAEAELAGRLHPGCPEPHLRGADRQRAARSRTPSPSRPELARAGRRSRPAVRDKQFDAQEVQEEKEEGQEGRGCGQEVQEEKKKKRKKKR